MRTMLVLVAGFLSVSLALWNGCLGGRQHEGVAPLGSSEPAHPVTGARERSGIRLAEVPGAKIEPSRRRSPTTAPELQ